MTSSPENEGVSTCCGNNTCRDGASLPKIAVSRCSVTCREVLQSDTIWLPRTQSYLGTDRPLIPADGESPLRPVTVAAFGVDRVAVSNDRFATFVADTGYRTEAEHYGWSYVFHLLLQYPERHPSPAGTPWWRGVEGAAWHSPEGPGSTIADRGDHPVTHISWNDAVVYAAWAGGRLPSEAEWECAARAGQQDVRYPWGDADPDDSTFHCNIWQGQFPMINKAADGWLSTAPVQSFAPNGLGFYNMVGNVWEWCADRFRVRASSVEGRARDAAARADQERTQKGGSYLCHASYCHRYRIAARSGRSPDTSSGHSGFRLAWDISARA